MCLKKHQLVFYLLTCIVLGSSAQEPIVKPTGKNEAGISVFSIKMNYGLSLSSDYYVSFFNGIDYKRHFGLNALRLGMNYRDARDKVIGELSGTSHYHENRFSIGYQCEFSKKSIKPYLGVDLIYLFSKSQEEFSGGIWASYSKEDLSENGIGFAPLLGFNFLIFNSVSLSFEGDFEFFDIKIKGKGIRNEVDDIAARIAYEINRNERSRLLNPLKSMSLNFTF